MFIVESLSHADERCLGSIVRLLGDQSVSSETKTITLQDFKRIFQNPYFTLFLVRDDNISPQSYIGMASLFFQRTAGRWIAEMHDMVVDSSHRGMGLGDMLTKHLIEKVGRFAQEHQCEVRFMLTSRPAREAANHMYQKHGFTLVARAEPGEGNTNLYQMMVRP